MAHELTQRWGNRKRPSMKHGELYVSCRTHVNVSDRKIPDAISWVYLILSIPPLGNERIATGVKIPKSRLQMGRVVGDEDIYVSLRAQLQQLEMVARKIFSEHKVQGRILSPKELVAIMNSKKDATVTTMLLSELAEAFIEQQKDLGSSESTLRGYRSGVASVMRYVADEKKASDYVIQDIDLGFLTRYEVWLRKKGVAPKKADSIVEGLSLSTAALYTNLIKIIFEYAHNNGFILKNPFDGYKDKTRMIRNRAEANADQLDRKIAREDLVRIEAAVLEDAELERTRLLFLFQRWTGMAWADLAHQNIKKCIRIDLTERKSVIYNRVKTGELAIIPLFPETAAILEKLDYNINPGSYKRYLAAIRRLYRHYGIPNAATLGTHDARHTFGSEMLEMGFGMPAVSRMMGHNSILTTEKHYAKINNSMIMADYAHVKNRMHVAEQSRALSVAI